MCSNASSAAANATPLSSRGQENKCHSNSRIKREVQTETFLASSLHLFQKSRLRSNERSKQSSSFWFLFFLKMPKKCFSHTNGGCHTSPRDARAGSPHRATSTSWKCVREGITSSDKERGHPRENHTAARVHTSALRFVVCHTRESSQRHF